jgi:AraC-like DNA-binding protein
MGNYNTTLLAILCSCCCYFAFGQEDPSGLENLTFEELFIRVNKGKSFEEIDKIANTIVKKAKKENNYLFLIGGYQTHALIRNNDSVLIYCDSIINLKSKSPNPAFIREAYQIKADYFFNNNIYDRSLDNYLKVAEYAESENNIDKIIKSKYDIGTLKRRIGEKEEALNLYKEGYNYVIKTNKKLDTTLYLSVLTAIANIYNDMQQGDSSSFYNKLGMKVAAKYGKESYVKHFSLNEGVSLYYKGQFPAAIDSLEKHAPYYENKEDTNNLPYAYYYSGKSHQELGNEKAAIRYHKKVDSLFKKNEAVYNISRKSYEELIKHYRKEKDLKNQLYYINQLIKVDSLLHEEELYLSKGIFKEYDIPQLESEKEMILQQMGEKDLLFKKIILAFTILLAISLIVLIFQYYKKTVYKKKFDQIMTGVEDQKLTEVSDDKDKELNTANTIAELEISQEIINGILLGLQQFENQQKYLLLNLTLNSLAKELETNSNYLSKVINHYKKRSFSNYLNLLRVNYFIDLAKRDPNIRKFTIKAIANEVGFSNSESFSKAFYKHKGIKPSYFLKELGNSHQT